MTRHRRMFPGHGVARVCGILALMSMAFSSCTPGSLVLATISYQEVSVCASNLGDPANPPAAIFLIFEITSINNQESNAKPFYFNPQLLYLKGENGVDYAATSEPGTRGVDLVGTPFRFAQTQTVTAGSTFSLKAGAVVVTDTVAPNG